MDRANHVDRLDVIETLDRYADAVDRGRWEILDEILAEDVVRTWPDGRETVGRAEVVAATRGYLEHVERTHNIFGSYRVSVDGEAAEAKAHRRSYFGDAYGRGLFMESLGDYRVRLVRERGHWRITHFAESVFVRRGSADVFQPPASAS